MDTKPWWQSKTIWAQLVAGLAFGLKWLGIDIGNDSSALVDGILNVVGFVSLLVGIYGRWQATKQIGPPIGPSARPVFAIRN